MMFSRSVAVELYPDNFLMLIHSRLPFSQNYSQILMFVQFHTHGCEVADSVLLTSFIFHGYSHIHKIPHLTIVLFPLLRILISRQNTCYGTTCIFRVFHLSLKLLFFNVSICSTLNILHNIGHRCDVANAPNDAAFNNCPW